LEQEKNQSPGKQPEGKKHRFLPLVLVAAGLIIAGGWLLQSLPESQKKPQIDLFNSSGSITPNLVNQAEKQAANPVVSIAQKMSPAVTGITSIPTDGLLSRTGDEVTGSGVIFDAQNGYIVTNNHVVEGASRILVTLADGREIPAEIIGKDSHTDLAVLQVQAPNLIAAAFGDSDQVSVGETAVAIGNPLGMRFARSVTVGVISGINRKLSGDEGSAYPLLQTDAAINPGNSGGALINSRGEVIGINSVKIAMPGFEGMGFAIPSNQVKQVIASLIQHKEVVRPALGVTLKGEVTAEAAAYYHLPVDYGVVIEVHPTSPADKAGLRNMDIIIAVDDQVIRTAEEIRTAISQRQVGDTVQIKVIREKRAIGRDAYEEMVIPVILGRLGG
jgi:serine protease Do